MKDILAGCAMRTEVMVGKIHFRLACESIFQSESSRSVSENKGEIRWQQAKRETRSTRKGISR